MDLYQNIFSHPERIYDLLSFLNKSSSESLINNNGNTNKEQFLNNLFQPINILLTSNLQQRLKKKTNVYGLNSNDLLENVFSNNYDIKNSSLNPNQLQDTSISSFKQNFLKNDNNFNKLLYLLQFQVNPSIIVSAKGIINI